MPPPSFTLTSPPAATYMAGNIVPIQWSANGVVPGNTISLCYDKDTIAMNGNEYWIEIDQVAAASGVGSYSWNTTGVAAGTYHVGGYLWNGSKSFFSYLSQTVVIKASPIPIFGITAPTSGTYTVGQSVPIQWTAANVRAGRTISLNYDQDAIWWNGNEHWIEIDQIAAANGTGAYYWNTTGVAPGKYYMAGYMFQNGVPVFSHVTTSITIQAAVATPTFNLTGPTSGSFVAGQNVTIQWTAGNVAAGNTVSLCYDKDAIWWNGNESWIEIDKTSTANGNGSYTWNTTGVAPGTYYIAGYLWSNSAPTFSHLTKSITITAGNPLTVDASLPPQGPATSLSDQQLAPIVSEAERRWAIADGVQVLAAMAGVKVQVADLAGGLLGETSGKTILIDQDAAGYGWFVDPTLRDDAEFADVLGPHALGALGGSPAANRVDLLTTVMHELGHVVGFGHSASFDVMYPSLPLGERRLPAEGTPLAAIGVAGGHNDNAFVELDAVDQIFASSHGNDRKWSWR